MTDIGKSIVEDVSGVISAAKGKIKDVNPKQVLIKAMPYLIVWYIADKLAYGYRVSPGALALNKLMASMDSGIAFRSPLPSIHPKDMMFGIAVAVVLWLIIYNKSLSAKKYKTGIEYGSAKWGTPKDIEPYMGKEVFENNILLTATERLQMNGRPSSPKYARNKNVLNLRSGGR